VLIDLFHQVAAWDPALVGLCVFAVLLLCGFGLPLPEDVVLIFTGYACYLGVVPVWVAIVVTLAGVLIGDSTLWCLGHRFGSGMMRLWVFRHLLPPHRLEVIKTKYSAYRHGLLFAARFMPGLRAGVFFFAGLSGIPYRIFIRADGAAALLSVPAIVVATYLLGGQIDNAIRTIRGVEHWVAAGIIGLCAVCVAVSEVRRRRARAIEAKVPAAEVVTGPVPARRTSERMRGLAVSRAEKPLASASADNG
jgi:membrane protein DedA with SNARE-associated domain